MKHCHAAKEGTETCLFAKYHVILGTFFRCNPHHRPFAILLPRDFDPVHRKHFDDTCLSTLATKKTRRIKTGAAIQQAFLRRVQTRSSQAREGKQRGHRKHPGRIHSPGAAYSRSLLDLTVKYRRCLVTCSLQWPEPLLRVAIVIS